MPRLIRFLLATMRVIAMGLVICLAVGACTGRGAPRVVKIGLIAPFEGPSRPLGYSVLHAVRLRVQQWNEAGGSPQVELVALNDDGDPDLAATLPGQLAIDPDMVFVLGPPQGHTALASAEALAEHGLPTLSLAPLPDAPPSSVLPFAGTGSLLAEALDGHAPGAAPAWQMPLAAPGIWLGDPLALAALVNDSPELAPAAGSVAAEEAFGAWAGASANGLVWAAAVPDPTALPADFDAAFEAVAGSPPTPVDRLAYAAADQALRLLAANPSRASLLQALPSTPLPPIHLFRRQGDACCLPLSSEP